MIGQTFFLTSAIMALSAMGATAAPVYLGDDLIDVSVGSGTSPGSFNNTFSGGRTIAKAIDAPSADAEEFHSQTTHIWFTADEAGGGLELAFDFGTAYDISTLHFWNYTSEAYDVDEIAFTFFDSAMSEIGSLSVLPDLGSSPGIRAQDIALESPLNVEFATAYLTGSNRQVDFQNIGFTAEVSEPAPPAPPVAAVPLPAGLPLLLFGIAGIGLVARRPRV